MKAGFDVGSTLIKVVWQEDNHWQFDSTAHQPLDVLLRNLQRKQITQLHITGIGLNYLPLINGFELRKRKGDVIMAELLNQVAGVNYLLAQQGKSHIQDYLLVSIGTGTSYTRVRGASVRKFPLGNALAGGFLYGMSKFLGYNRYTDFLNIAKEGKLENVELLLKDKIAETASKPEGNLLVAHLAKAQPHSSKSDVQMGFLNMIAISAIRDIVLIDLVPEFSGFKQVVCIGSSIENDNPLKSLLIHYQDFIQKELVFVQHGAYANALGAYHLESNDMDKIE
ncbi:MAG: hypothetical protein NZ455_00290 [Bacteroidia bacterium]|nr:hypothetical protein [Bacteroidia bacterium]MDW8347342.1 hypothetical protein [Bacteroidia bacterium]